MRGGEGPLLEWVDLSVGMSWVPFTLFALWLTERHPIGHRRLSALPIHLGGLVFMLVGRGFVVTGIGLAWGYYPNGLPPIIDIVLKHLRNDLVPYVLLVGAAHAVYYARVHREREALLGRAELNALRAKIQPHFLYNALNTITSLVHHRPDQAEDMITRLGTLLRYSLDSDDALEVPLRDELEVLHAYLAIEQVRFSDRLTVKWAVDDDTLDALIPPLLLQPLAENAIRHGLSPRAASGLLLINACRHGRDLRLSVEDDGVGLADGQPHPGVGLGTARARLAQMYGNRHQFTLRSRPDGGVIAELTIPYSAQVPA